jgi:hypothetical protein
MASNTNTVGVISQTGSQSRRRGELGLGGLAGEVAG